MTASPASPRSTVDASASPDASGAFLRALSFFALAASLLIVIAAVLLTRFVYAAESNAVWTVAAVAIVTQLFSFAIARLVARQQMIAGWGLGIALRIAIVAVIGFAGPALFGVSASAALLAIALFFFVSTVVEPLFLTL
jgi:hypothetical protein